MSAEAGFLHDGRARTLQEAILWHGGEAQKARDNYVALPKAERDALASHASQVSDAGEMLKMPDDIFAVAFGMEWLRRLKPAGQSEWDAYVQNLQYPLRPNKSIGDIFHAEPRLAAGMTPDFLDRLQHDSGTPSPE